MEQDSDSVDRMRKEIREYLSAAAKLYAEAVADADQASRHLSDAEKALRQMNLVITQIGDK